MDLLWGWSEMACILVQYDPPRDPGLFQQYSRWIDEEGRRMIVSLEGLTELRVFRNVTGGSPVVTAMAFFDDLPAALAVGRTPLWSELVANLTRWGCDGLLVTLLQPSPLMPEAQRFPAD